MERVRDVLVQKIVQLLAVLFITHLCNIWVHLTDLLGVYLTFKRNVTDSMEAVKVIKINKQKPSQE